jgi:hypothetical protein
MAHTTAIFNPQNLKEIAPPYPCTVSGDLDASRQRLYQWITEQSLHLSPRELARFKAADFPGLVARCYPWAQGADLDLLNQVTGWAFLFDDSFDTAAVTPEEVAGAFRLYRNVNSGQPLETEEPPLVALWRQLLSRLDSQVSENARLRYREHWECTYRATEAEARHRTDATVPRLEDFIPARRAAGGALQAFDWAEIVGAYTIPQNVLTDGLFRGLAGHAMDVICWTNDLFSLRKDSNDGNRPGSLVLILAEHRQLSLEDAVELARKMIRDALQRFQESEMEFLGSECYERLSPLEKEITRRHISVMKDWMRGNFEWHFLSGRYK